LFNIYKALKNVLRLGMMKEVSSICKRVQLECLLTEV
jgi:hypothetical protein